MYLSLQIAAERGSTSCAQLCICDAKSFRHFSFAYSDVLLRILVHRLYASAGIAFETFSLLYAEVGRCRRDISLLTCAHMYVVQAGTLRNELARAGTAFGTYARPESCVVQTCPGAILMPQSIGAILCVFRFGSCVLHLDVRLMVCSHIETEGFLHQAGAKLVCYTD